MIYKPIRERCGEKLWTGRKIRKGKCGMVITLALLLIEQKKNLKLKESKKQINTKNILNKE